MTRAETRWGCFLPDLTRLARGSSTTNLPAPISSIGSIKARAATVDSGPLPLISGGSNNLRDKRGRLRHHVSNNMRRTGC